MAGAESAWRGTNRLDGRWPSRSLEDADSMERGFWRTRLRTRRSRPATAAAANGNISVPGSRVPQDAGNLYSAPYYAWVLPPALFVERFRARQG
jgi:hypothetical protein